MKIYSFWAKTHPTQARWAITGAHFLLFLLAFILAFQLWTLDFPWSPLMHDIFTTLFLLALIGYPIKGLTNPLWQQSYKRQKAFDFALVFTGFLALSALVDMNLEWASSTISEGYAVQTSTKTPEKVKSTLAMLKENMSWHALKKNARMLKKELRAARKMAPDNGKDTALRILGTFLVLLVALGLAYLIAAWSCNLACSGQEGASNVVLIGGGALLILLTVLAIRAIWRKRTKPKASKVE